MKHACLILASLGLVLCGVGQANAGPVVVNGSFEQVQIGSPFVSSNPADIPGWTHTGAQGDGLLWAVGYADGGGSVTVAGDGNQFVTMGNGFFNNSGAFSRWDQAVTGFTSGQTYTLSFKMAAEAAFEVPTQNLTVDFLSGSSTAAQTFTSSLAGPGYWRNWAQESMTFVATASIVDIRFGANGQFDVGLDSVNVSPTGATPEPATLTMLGFGIAGMAGYGWRRRQRTAAV